MDDHTPDPEALVRRYWALMASNDFESVSAVLAPDFVLDWPQSGERIHGPARYAQMNAEYPAHGPWRFAINRLVAQGDAVFTEVDVTDGQQRGRALSCFTIAQGRIIQATLETAINTDLSAPIRAVVSVDTYGEAGTVPLIPKGSRLIGRYNNVVTSGQTRVFAIWTRIIRPDGVDIELGSPESALIDAIGQAGVAGQLDTKFQEIFARSLVSSAMNIAMAIGSDKISGGGTTTTTNSTQGGSQTSGDSVTTATTNALNRLGSTTDGFLQKFLSVPPTILVDQGTKVNVFVNKDIVFPNDLAGAQVIP